MFKNIKAFFILLGTIALSILIIILAKSRGRYLVEKLKMELERKKLKDKADKLEKQREKNTEKILSLDANKKGAKDTIHKKALKNKDLERKIGEIKEEVSNKDKNIDDLVETIKGL